MYWELLDLDLCIGHRLSIQDLCDRTPSHFFPCFGAIPITPFASELWCRRADLISFLYAKHGEAYDENVGTAESMIALPREKIVYLLMAMVALYLIAGTAAELVCNFIGFAYPAYASVKVRVQ
ncbi:unnamed protein product [Strongylus vulgaris]|uniref:Uncharacterized protein n=1 Tax=Strongylus vulgaris TaxID=40348 RepID=A0A3P7JIJ4_STRVU|nr:unnamed protein product [Strongylus vulgaris]